MISKQRFSHFFMEFPADAREGMEVPPVVSKVNINAWMVIFSSGITCSIYEFREKYADFLRVFEKLKRPDHFQLTRVRLAQRNSPLDKYFKLPKLETVPSIYSFDPAAMPVTYRSPAVRHPVTVDVFEFARQFGVMNYVRLKERNDQSIISEIQKFVKSQAPDISQFIPSTLRVSYTNRIPTDNELLEELKRRMAHSDRFTAALIQTVRQTDQD